jgi:Fur family ferric uptake transcriptional regulator
MKKTKNTTTTTNRNKKAEVEALLRGNGFKVTGPRTAILSLFSEKCAPMSAEQIFKKLSPDTGVDLVTVYRTMASFEEKGIMKRIDLHKDAVYFEINGDDTHHHHHIVCNGCGKIEKMEKCPAEPLARTAASHSAHFAEVTAHSLEFFGMCKSCAKH